MHEHEATIIWKRGDARFVDNRYSRVHEWRFDGGTSVAASASPLNVRGPYTSSDAVDPEEAYVASLSSCHMLWFLFLAAKRGWVVDSYVDRAVGVMDEDTDGKMWIPTVTLHPITTFSDKSPTRSELESLHHDAHEECFLAKSVRTRILVELE